MFIINLTACCLFDQIVGIFLLMLVYSVGNILSDQLYLSIVGNPSNCCIQLLEHYFHHVLHKLKKCSCRCSSSYQNQANANTGLKGGTTIDNEEVRKFSEISQHWWNESGEFAALHTLNRLRVPLIRDGISARASGNDVPASQPLHGLSVLDVGCGGGILSEPLARLGASVTGLDASEENIIIANQHAKLDAKLHGRCQYICSPVEELDKGAVFDGVVASEILEHVNDPHQFLSSCCSLVAPGGSLFITSINRTWLSQALAVYAAEKLLRIVPDGAHDWNKFVHLDELCQMLSQNGMSVRLIHGMMLNPVSLKWSWMKNNSMNYALQAVKPDVTA